MRLAQQELWLLPLKDLFVVLGCCNSRGFQKRLHSLGLFSFLVWLLVFDKPKFLFFTQNTQTTRTYSLSLKFTTRGFTSCFSFLFIDTNILFVIILYWFLAVFFLLMLTVITSKTPTKQRKLAQIRFGFP